MGEDVRYIIWISLASLLIGCVNTAPPLPRHVSRVHEPGFTGAQTGTENRQMLLVVGAPVWEGVPADIQQEISSDFSLTILSAQQYGMIVDAQSADESTSATYAGAAVGSGAAQVLYIDRSFRHGNYSAGTHLGLGLLGALAGSALDRPAIEKYVNRYTVQTADGEIQYIDETKATKFRHSVGVCVTVPQLEQLSQKVCTETPDDFTARMQSGGDK